MPNMLLDEDGEAMLDETDADGTNVLLDETNSYTLTQGLIVDRTFIS